MMHAANDALILAAIETNVLSVDAERSILLAQEFSVTPTHIRHIATGRRWVANQKFRIGKRAAGRLLDGVEHNAMPGKAGA